MRLWLGLMAATALTGQNMPLPEILSRVSEEAEIFRRVAPETLAEETLTQRSLKPPPRFRRRGATAPNAAPEKPEYLTRQITSEYSFATLRESGALHEFRQVTAVDGRRVSTPESARHALGLGMRSEDDRARKRMLEDFQKVGLQGAATDFGQLILLFTKRQLENYDFRPDGYGRIGVDQMVVLAFSQRQGSPSMLVFEGRKTVRAKLDGQLWVRRKDGVPLRIILRSQWTEQKRVRKHEAVVDYTPTPFGIVEPASVKHSEFMDEELVTENLFRYSTFKKFGADAEIKFDTLPEQPKK